MKKPHKLKKLLLLVSLSLSFNSIAQFNYEKADSIALSFTETFVTVQELANKLTPQLTSDVEKARVFFMWIANNVSYDCRKFHNPTKPHITARNKEELKKKVKTWKEKQILRTAQKKRGICEDYSQLYKALCDEVGLEAIVVYGNSRDFYRPNRSSHNNPHAWNAVKIEEKWYLLDATWGAGYTNPEVTRFTRKISPGFFFTNPSLFSQNHLPNEVKWQLLDNPISEKDFSSQPVINYGQEKYKIIGFTSLVNNIPGKKKTKQIWLQFENVPKEFILTTKNRKHKNRKQIEFKKEIVNNKVVFSYSASYNKVVIFGGKSLRKKMDYLAMYKSVK